MESVKQLKESSSYYTELVNTIQYLVSKDFDSKNDIECLDSYREVFISEENNVLTLSRTVRELRKFVGGLEYYVTKKVEQVKEDYLKNGPVKSGTPPVVPESNLTKFTGTKMLLDSNLAIEYLSTRLKERQLLLKEMRYHEDGRYCNLKVKLHFDEVRYYVQTPEDDEDINECRIQTDSEVCAHAYILSRWW